MYVIFSKFLYHVWYYNFQKNILIATFRRPETNQKLFHGFKRFYEEKAMITNWSKDYKGNGEGG